MSEGSLLISNFLFFILLRFLSGFYTIVENFLYLVVPYNPVPYIETMIYQKTYTLANSVITAGTTSVPSVIELRIEELQANARNALREDVVLRVQLCNGMFLCAH